MKIRVTGGSGFLGGYLVPALKTEGNEIFAERFDVLDPLACEQAMEGMDQVYHLAAKIAVKPSDRALATRVNVQGTKNVVDAAIQAKVKRFLHVSSVATVGVSVDQTVLSEESKHILADRGFPNFDSKIRSEQYVLNVSKDNAIDAVVVNPSMIFGAGDAKKAARKGNILAAKGKLPFFTKGGLSVVSVEDVVEGMIAAMEKGRKGERYILSGDNLSFQEVFTLYASFGKASPPKHAIATGMFRLMAKIAEGLRLDSDLSVESATAASSYHWFDYSKAAKELGYKPASSLTAIEKSFRYMSENGYLK